MRTSMPARRRSNTFKGKTSGVSYFVTVGYHADGEPGEVFIDCMRVGSGMRTMFDAFAQILSVALQCGTPVSDLHKALSGLKTPCENGFDPAQVLAFTFECLTAPPLSVVS